MGIKSGYTTNIEGDRIYIAFLGENISDADDLDIISIILSMDGGGGEPAPVKYTTATVEVAADGLQHTDIFKDQYTIVGISNESTEEILFLGYVSPNNYDVQITGANDSFVIECVDFLGFSKFMPFNLENTGVGPGVVTIARLLDNSLALPHFYGADSISLVSGELSTRRYDLMTLLETYFMNDSTPMLLGKAETGRLSYEPNMMTIYEVLEMIAESLRMTWIQVGNAIYLHDYIQSKEIGVSKYRELTTGDMPAEVERGVVHEIDEDSFDGTGIKVSALPRYSLVSIERECEEEVSVMPDFFDTRYMYEVGNVIADGNWRIQQLESKLFPAPLVGLVGYMTIDNNVGTRWNKRWATAIRLGRGGGGYDPIFSYRCRIPARGIDSFLGFRLSWEVMFSDSGAIYPGYPKTIDNTVVVCSLKVGDKWLVQPSGDNLWLGGWSDTLSYFNVTTSGVNGWGNRAVIMGFSGYLDLSKSSFGLFSKGGPVEFTIHSSPNYDWTYMFLRNLQLKEVLTWDGMSQDAVIPKVQQIGSWAFMKEAPAVKLPIQINAPTAGKSFGLTINDINYYFPDDDAGIRYGSDGEMTMIERVEALTNFGDGLEYTIPLRDNNNKIKAYDVFTSPLWEGNKVIAGFEKDIVNSSINVTID